MFQKILILLLFSLSLWATNIEYGKGNFEVTAGFKDYKTTLSNDISTYSLVEHHKNLLSSNWFYKYNFTWYSSKTLTQAQDSATSNLPAGFSSFDYKLKGLDLNAVIGRDLYHKDENNFIGVGILIGISTPIIEGLDNNDSDSSNDNSKTEILSYKIGPSIYVSWNQNKYLMFYGSATYAFQTLRVKNSYLQLDTQVNGIFEEYDFGLKVQPFAEDYQTKYMTFSPRFYGTLGFRYTKWDLNDMSINFAGNGQSSDQVSFTTTASIAYFGIGYDFF